MMANEQKLRDYLKRVTGDLQQTRERLRAVEDRAQARDGEPIAVIGMACRYPGAPDGPEELWRLVEGGGDAIGDFPEDRGWDLARLHAADPDRPGTSYVRQGGFLDDVAGFDAGLFGMNPREAAATDPQQRLLLELTWRLFEDAGIPVAGLRGSTTGVYAGVIAQEYGPRLQDGSAGHGGYLLTGTTTSVASGRIAYQFGFEGPAVTVDTACSSSLVAVHLAAQALRGGECTLAVAGGATVLTSPGVFVEFSRQRGLAPDGRCKSFGEGADGTNFAEGGGLLLLERLSDARRAGHRVLAVLAGSAVNSDGASNGLTAPNGPSQERVIRAALAAARLSPADVDAVEAHGTGTSLGDPIEAQALLATYGRGRAGRPLLLGSVKSNIGHTQAAAGVAGVIKTILALRHGALPPTLHAGTPSAQVDWEQGAVELVQERTPWPRGERPRRAGVSSFGISGTNAHVIVAEAPAEEPSEGEPAADGPPVLSWVLSGATPGALRAHAGQLHADLLARPALAAADVAHTLAARRTALEHRAAVTGADRGELLAGLAALAEGAEHPGVDRGTALPGGTAFLFTGQGSQHPGMGAALRAHPVFARAFDEVAAHLDPLLDRPLRDLLEDADGAALDRTGNAQPALFAHQVALARLLESWGVRPDFLVGHSVGEIAAAHLAGVLPLADACTLVAARGRLMQALPEGGAMSAIEATEDEVRASLAGVEDRVALAAVNGPAAVVVSGEAGAVARVTEQWRAGGRRVRRLRVSHAFHSPLMDPVLAPFRAAVRGLAFAEPELPIVSTVTGALAAPGELSDPEYWVRQVRATVRFADAAATATGLGAGVFLELGPDSVLTQLVDTASGRAAAVATARAGQDEARTLARALARLHVHGAGPDWSAVLPGRAVELPGYPFQHARFWLDGGERAALGGHPLLTGELDLAAGGSSAAVFTGRLSTTAQAWAADHTIAGTVLLPGTAFVELAVHAGRRLGCPVVEELVLAAPLPLRAAPLQLQVTVGTADEEGVRELLIHSRPEDGAPWTRHASGTVRPARASAAGPAPDAAWPPAGAVPLDSAGLYPQLAERGYAYGPQFRLVRALWRAGDVLAAELRAPQDTEGFGVHPALLDAALHALVTAVPGEPGSVLIPFAWSGVRVHATGAGDVRVLLRPAGGEGEFRVEVTDPAGGPVVTVERLTLRPLAAAALAAGPAPAAGHELGWVPVDPPRATGPAPEVLLRSPGTAAELLALLQDFTEDPARSSATLVVATGGAVAAAPGDRVEALDQAPLWGLARSAQAEYPGRIVLVDTDAPITDPAALVRTGEPQLALRGGVLTAPRILRSDPARRLRPPAGPGWRLDVTRPGTFAGLALVPVEPAPLAAGQVRIAVRAAGLNFRDVMIALGMYPGRAQLGGEAAGVVVETASDVTGLRPGDRVMGLVPGAVGPYAVTDRRHLVPLPEGWTFAQGAATPIVFMTAYYGLVDLAGLRPGQSVLIHAAAGGVGMAATQLARHLGAEVYGTASPAKWPVLRAAGLDAEHIASSRTLEFAGAFPGGFDVVLNSLAGEFVDASLGLLAPGGRFLEMGKTDIRELPAPGYQAFDLLEAGPDRIQQLLTALTGLFAAGALHPLPVTAWDVTEAPEAFRHISQARHVGKVVLTLPRALDPDGTVLVTGGTSGLGALAARHLVAAHGARHVLLAGRTGQAPGLAAELTAAGAEVTVARCDVADRGALAGLLAGIPAAHPLTAVVHAAGVLDDAPLGALDPERLAAVLRPKADAARHLHELTADADLAAFVLFSSVAGVLGNAGQANYAAANAYLDALAAQRRTAGLTAVSIAWGPWAEGGGMTGRLAERDLDRIRASGLAALSVPQGLALLDAALAGGPALLVAARPHQPGLDARAARGELPPLLGLLADAPVRTAATAAAGAAPLAERLAGTPADQREHLLLDLIRTQVATVLGHAAPQALERDRPFSALGFDSLTAVELRNRLAAATGLRLSATLLFDHPSPGALAAHLYAELLGGPAAGAGAPLPETAAGADEEIAIIAMSCRYPGGVRTPEDLWRLVAEGRDAIGEFPVNRGWQLDGLFDPDPDHPGTSYTDRGAFLHDADQFDAELFGLSPRETVAADPQQRLLLEAAWELFERAGIDPTGLAGTQTGVFTGVIAQDYGVAPSDPATGVEGYLSTGTTTSVASGRIAYTFGLEGPAVTVDTACSSSLVAIHLAGQALRSGECSLALAGGATVMATPRTFVEFSRQRGLAPDGRTKAFADAADGTGWGEGAGLLLLERLGDARRNGHRVLAVVKGSAVNSDGASNGLTAPSGPSQQRVIRRALAAANLRPADVDAVEAHGTGTVLGDPIEAQALLATYGQDRQVPLRLGSVKSNIGHTLAAAGVAGVIKMVQAMHHQELPRTLHVDRPSSHVDWTAGAVELLTEPVPWPRGERPRRAGVSSFGISGTNAHVIVEEPPAAPEEPGAAPADGPAQPVAWVLSGQDERALRAQAANLADHLRATPAPPAAVAAALATGRAALARRAVVVGTGGELHAGLRALAAGEEAPNAVAGSVTDASRVVFVFPGQGSQWHGMARELLDSSEVFRTALEECDRALGRHVDWSLLAVLRGEDGAPPADRVDVVQPALFAVMVALARLWQAHGVRPSAVVGHSQGEIAAACVAGALSLEDAAAVVALRSRAIAGIAGDGGMASVAGPVEQVEALLARFGGRLGVAAVNGPAATVVSGPAADLDELLAGDTAGLRVRRVPVDYASHSPLMAGLRERILHDLAAVRPRPAGVAVYSALTGDAVDPLTLTADYWYTNLRETVRFDRASEALLRDGYRVFVECSPHPVLTHGLHDTIEAGGHTEGRTRAVALGTLRRDQGGPHRFLLALGEAHTAGVRVEWPGPSGASGTPPQLPTYPFQRSSYWLAPAARAGDPAGLGLEGLGHGLLGALLDDVESGGPVLTGLLSTTAQPWLRDHAVDGTVLLPGTAFVELAVTAAQRSGCERVEELTVQAPLPLPTDGGGVRLRVTVGAWQDGRRTLAVHARPEHGGSWQRHATGVLGAAAGQPPAPVPLPAAAAPVDLAGAYDRLADAALEYGPAFQGLTAAWRSAAGLHARVELAQGLAPDAFTLHPALLDAALHVLALDQDAGPGTVPLPFSWSGVTWWRRGGRELLAHLRPTGQDTFALLVTDPLGEPVAEVTGLAVRRVPLERVHGGRGRTLFTVDRVDAPPGQEPVGARWALLGPDHHGVVVPHAGPAVDAATAAADVLVVQVAPGGTAEAARAAARGLLPVLRSWLAREDRGPDARLVVVTREHDLAGATAAGLVRAAQAEHPGALVLLAVDGPPAGDLLRAALATGEPQLSARQGRLLVPRLATAAAGAELPVWRADGTVLITGGTGTLGRLLARHLLARHGAGQVLLVSRGGEAGDVASWAGEFADRVRVAACDVTDRGRLAALLASVPADRPLRAVVHAAGVLDDGVLQSLTEERLEAVLRVKADAAWHLHELTRGLPLDAFVLYSSFAGVAGSAGQAAYAAGNAFLDELAARRRAEGLPAVSLAWGLWEPRSELTDGADVARTGVRALDAETGLALFDEALATGLPLVAPVALDLPTLRARARDGELPPLLRSLVPVAAKERTADLAGLPEAERAKAVAELVTTTVAAVLGHRSAAAVDAHLSFAELGFDSLTGLELRNRLGARTGLRLPAATVFDHPTPAQLTAHLTALLEPAPPAPPGSAELDGLELLLGAADPRARDELTARLRALLGRWETGAADAEAGDAAAAEDVAERIRTADTASVLAFIDSELGRAR
ncbi:SDR family NAD(P)-dependent oxidoreductase [Streptomyces sp. NPDC020983]|uniref:SDR family NAD(P)-dependent oxidoreductase n=1 Tax=Streptomyces sp. NPDC020983 TaxID=3365106 RepID=UPI00378AADA0